MTPEEYQQVLAQRPRRRRENMWALTNDNGFIFGNSPFNSSSVFDEPSPFDRDSPFFPKKRRQ